MRSLQWIFRAYDDGVAFRYFVPADAGLKTLNVRAEETEFTFGGDYTATDSISGASIRATKGSSTRSRRATSASTISTTCRWCAARPTNAFAIGEADLVDYGGLYLSGRGDGKPGVQARVSRRLDDKTR